MRDPAWYAEQVGIVACRTVEFLSTSFFVVAALTLVLFCSGSEFV